MSDKVNMAVKLDQKMRTRLHALGDMKRRTPHWLMCEAVRLYVEREEEVEREKAITRERLARYDATGEFVADEDMQEWLRSIGSKHERSAPTRIQRRKPAR